MSLKDGVKIIIQDVVEPEPEKEGCLTKIGSFFVVMAIIITLLVLLFKFFMNHLFLFFILLVGFIIVATKFGRN
ncbi:histidine kinase [Enterococcus faecalis]|uniref:histidine kinase n=1 Tax=Enterococcus faecalis TaxID=1351 RepID=UPI002555BCA0|nr:histidine kinase [Enterococcus faecalis]